jgi:protein TonB
MKLAIKYLLALTVICHGNKAFSQTEPVGDPEKVHTYVELMPRFPGGDEGLIKFITTHLVYPPAAVENNVEGKVLVQFVVDRQGYVKDVKVFRSVNRELDSAAISVVKLMPRWTPGSQDGEPVNVRYSLPVTFRLNDPTPPAQPKKD